MFITLGVHIHVRVHEISVKDIGENSSLLVKHQSYVLHHCVQSPAMHHHFGFDLRYQWKDLAGLPCLHHDLCYDLDPHHCCMPQLQLFLADLCTLVFLIVDSVVKGTRRTPLQSHWADYLLMRT